MHDLHNRYPGDPGPLVPGQGELRYDFLDGDHPDVIRIRQDIQEEGKGLFAVRLGYTGVKALVEAYYPEDIRSLYAAKHLDPFRLVDYKMGRLIVVAVLFKYIGEMDPRQVTVICMKNRNARANLKRAHDAHSLALEIQDSIAAEEQQAIDNFSEFYTDAYANTLDFAMGKPRVSAYNPHHR